jgi:uncharacterized protein
MMKIVIDSIVLRPGRPEQEIGEALAQRLGIAAVPPYTILRKSLDARKRSDIVYRYRVACDLPDEAVRKLIDAGEAAPYTEHAVGPAPVLRPECSVLIIGSGPAGLFCALRLIEAGARVEVLERGKPVEERIKDIEELESRGVLNERSNVLFGEGGAGTYSDGKLTTRTRKPEIDWVFRTLVAHGAPSSILYEAKPHLGTDRLRGILRSIRGAIQEAGSSISFNESADDFIVHNGSIAGIVTGGGREVRSEKVVLAIGHSARDTYAMLLQRGVSLEKKGFAAGIRIEHPAALINRIQYGDSPYRDILPAAEYALTFNDAATGRGVYSFCMCPGGRVINSSSEQEMLCTNGMSFSKRNHPFSNAAIVVTISPDDSAGGPLDGIDFQRMLESSAFRSGGGLFHAPAQRVTSFISGRLDTDLPEVSYRPGVVPARLDRALPGWLVDAMKQALPAFGRSMKGFITDQAVFIGAETRTSSPVRIVRDESFQSVSVRGLYPVGEGAGYAGGIVSSAVDGVRCADRIIGGEGR